MRRGVVAWLAAVAIMVGPLLAGCGDSNLFEGQSDASGSAAKLEEGLAAIDDGNWDRAIEIFEGLDDTDPDVMKYLASAYVGATGFDTLTLVEEIADAQDSGEAEEIIYRSVTNLFDDDGDGLITTDELGEKADLIADALAVFGVALDDFTAGRLAAADLSGLTDEQVFQVGIYAALHAVLSVVYQLDHPTNVGQLLLTVEEVRAHPEVIGDPEEENPTEENGVVAPPSLDNDLDLVREAVLVLDPDLDDLGVDVEASNDLAAELDDFLVDLGYLGGDTPNEVTTAELRAYLHRLVDAN